jgi:hypothetical protein
MGVLGQFDESEAKLGDEVMKKRRGSYEDYGQRIAYMTDHRQSTPLIPITTKTDVAAGYRSSGAVSH